MRRVLLAVSAALLGLLLMGSGSGMAMPRACGGFTIVDDDPCCVSGTVLYSGKPVSGAQVTAEIVGGNTATDITDYATPYDEYPTYGFLLDSPELKAEPGDQVILTVSYKGIVRSASFTVKAGEQWIDIELVPPKRGPR